MLKKEVAVQLFEHLLDCLSHGYTMNMDRRWGNGNENCVVTINNGIYHLRKGDRDCASSIISAYKAAGIDCGGATYTGNMRTYMVDTGNFRWHPWGDGYVEKRGDIYLNEAEHTAMCLSANPRLLGEFSGSEDRFNRADGQTGDQGDLKFKNTPFYYPDYGWDGILECICTEEDGSIKRCVTLQDMDYSTKQRWKLETVSGNQFRLKNVATNLYLDIKDANPDYNGELVAFWASGSVSQVFTFEACYWGLLKAYMMKTFSGKVIENTYGISERALRMMDPNRMIHQQWVLLGMDNGDCVVINQRSGLVLGVL